MLVPHSRLGVSSQSSLQIIRESNRIVR